jgi:hypothetical protein
MTASGLLSRSEGMSNGECSSRARTVGCASSRPCRTTRCSGSCILSSGTIPGHRPALPPNLPRASAVLNAKADSTRPDGSARRTRPSTGQHFNLDSTREHTVARVGTQMSHPPPPQKGVGRWGLLAPGGPRDGSSRGSSRARARTREDGLPTPLEEGAAAGPASGARVHASKEVWRVPTPEPKTRPRRLPAIEGGGIGLACACAGELACSPPVVELASEGWGGTLAPFLPRARVCAPDRRAARLRVANRAAPNELRTSRER